jgi:hypothetical protein
MYYMYSREVHARGRHCCCLPVLVQMRLVQESKSKHCRLPGSGYAYLVDRYAYSSNTRILEAKSSRFEKRGDA